MMSLQSAITSLLQNDLFSYLDGGRRIKQLDSPILQMKKGRDELVCPALFRNKPISDLQVLAYI